MQQINDIAGLTIKARLGLTVGFLAALLIVIGAIGITGISRTHRNAEEIRDRNLEPVILLEKLRHLVSENRSQILLALQHSTDNPFHTMHDHPLTFHTGNIDKNAAEIEKLMEQMRAAIPKDETSQKLFQTFHEARDRLISDGINPSKEQQLAGNFTESNVILLKQINPGFRALSEAGKALEDHLTKAADDATAAELSEFVVTRNTAIATILIGVALALFSALQLIRAIVRPLEQAIVTLDQIARGNLDNRIEVRGRNEIPRVMNALASMQGQLRDMIGQILRAGDAIASGTQQLNAEIDKVAGHSRSQQDRVMQVSAAMEEVSVSVTEVANGSDSAANAARESMAMVRQGNTQMAKSMEVSTKVARTVEASSQTITALNENIQKIGAITNVIKEIADQTNLLALNAAIEAARAGEQGRGFAVVADEVRKLAERTAQSTGDITAMVEGIQGKTDAAVEAMTGASREVEEELELVRATNETLNQILAASERVNDLAQHIASASKEQSVASEDVAKNMEQISTLIEENTASIQQVEGASADLAHTAGELRALVKRFSFEGTQ